MSENAIPPVAAEIRAWVQQNWTDAVAAESLLGWRERLLAGGWACVTWPSAWFGRDADPATEQVVHRELARHGSPGPAGGFGPTVAGPLLLEQGRPEQLHRYLRPIATGREKWCELFTEPGNGSDLAAVSTSARPDGDDWILAGTKSWVSAADVADHGLLLARTDPGAGKHAGLTMFVLPMRAPGVDVELVPLMNGSHSYRVHLNDVRVGAAHVLGGAGAGWSVAQATLALERRLGAAHGAPTATRLDPGVATDEYRAELETFAKAYEWLPSGRGRPDLLLDWSRTARPLDPAVRTTVLGALVQQQVTAWTVLRLGDGTARPVHPSIVKLAGSATARLAGAAHVAVAGPSALAVAGDRAGLVAEILLSGPAISLIGGTDEIQRNILAERVLGLPRDQSPAKERPSDG